MTCVPKERLEVVKVAVPPERVALPIEVPPSRKVTVPVAVPAAGLTALTVAIKFSAWPKSDGFCELVTVVVQLPLLTVWVIAADVLLLKLASPA